MRAHLSEMDIVDEVNGECLSFLGQLQRQVEDLQRNQLNMQHEIEASGPIGLIIRSVIWHGLNIDRRLNIWQDNEEPINILIRTSTSNR